MTPERAEREAVGSQLLDVQRGCAYQRRHRKWLVQELHGLQDAYNTLEADRDKWMGQFDEAEHRGLAYMEERNKLVAKLKECEAYNENMAEEAAP